MVVSMRGDDGEWNAAQVPMGRAVRGIFDAIGVPHATVESPESACDTVRLAGKTAFAHAHAAAPVCCRDGLTRRRRRRCDRRRRLAHDRLEATRAIVELAGGAPIVASLGHPAYDLFAAGDRPQNFYTWGSMGLASSIGLGLALARPDLRVIVLDGDGSLLMNLGSLATIGLLQPTNLVRRRDGQRGVRDDRRSADADRARRRPRGRGARDGDRRDGDGARAKASCAAALDVRSARFSSSPR